MENDEHKSGEKSPILPKYYKAEISDGSNKSNKFTSSNNCYCKLGVVVLIALILIIVIALSIGLGTYYGKKSSSTKESLVDSIKTSDLRDLLLGLQDTVVNNSRSVLTGFNNSGDFVFDLLLQNGYTPSRQYFTIPVPEENEGYFTATWSTGGEMYDFEYIQDNQFRILIYSAGCIIENDGDCSWNLASLMDDDMSEYGCSEIDSDITGKAVLVPYDTAMGNCSLYEKAANVKAAGGTAIIFVSGSTTPPRARVFERNDDGTVSYEDILAISIINATANQLLDIMNIDPDMQVTLELSAGVTLATTYNIFAETEAGREDRVVMIGSHLDSVPAGPGINDDGSGSMTNMITALQIAKLNIKPQNKIRFAWWGAEELGLLGSRFYVAKLSEEAKKNISLYLNFDMLGSTNFQRGVYSAESAMDENLLQASTKIQNLFIEYFESINRIHELVPFSGGSDYRPFLDAGIPAGGLFTGAGAIKTEEQWELFGGIINAPLDPCYHQACDTVNNVNYDIYLEMTRSTAYTLQTLAEQENLEEYLKS